MSAAPYNPPGFDDRLMWDNWLSLHRLPAMSVADEAGIFAALCKGALPTDEMAASLNVNARALAIHLGLLASMGLAERREGRWQATAQTRAWLDPTGAGYWGPLLAGYKLSNPLHAQMLKTLEPAGGESGHVSAVAEWERGDLPAEFALRIAGLMNSHSISASEAVARLPLWRDVPSLLDVGGGSGIFAIAVARQWPGLQATVLDIDTMCDAAQTYIDAAGAADRVKTVAVNMFTAPLPTGHDALFFSNIFHDWSDATCALLARKAFEALPVGGRILLHEMLMDDDGCGPATTASFSMLMLLGTKGRQYSFADLRAILEGAGFTDVRSQLTGSGYYSLVSAQKPPPA